MVTSESTRACSPSASTACRNCRPGDSWVFRSATTSAMVRLMVSVACMWSSPRPSLARVAKFGLGRFAGDEHAPAELAPVDRELDLAAGLGEGQDPVLFDLVVGDRGPGGGHLADHPVGL